jgi:predicted DNA-binding transcriptional regulator AlpA
MNTQTVTIIKEIAQPLISSIYLSDAQVANRYDVSRNTIWRWVRNKTFPTPVKLSPGCTRFKLLDVEAWEAAK